MGLRICFCHNKKGENLDSCGQELKKKESADRESQNFAADKICQWDPVLSLTAQHDFYNKSFSETEFLSSILQIVIS